MIKINTLQDFYKTMAATRQVRKKMVAEYLQNNRISHKGEIEDLKNALDALENIAREGKSFILKIDAQKSIEVDLGYEIDELKRDIVFLENGEEALTSHLSSIHPGFSEQVQQGVEFLNGKNIQNLITDRDGTINNYCGRYRSSIQSLYNAVYLTRFARKKAKNSIVLTSAPLQDPGLVDVSTTPDEDFIYAASKGREFMLNGKRQQLAIAEKKQAMLDALNDKLDELLKNPAYEKFGLIGSGIQHKFGQTTIARQDVSKSVSEKESQEFFKSVVALVNEIDPGKHYFRIEDTGKDIEIILTVNSDEGGTKDFDKGDGVMYLNETLNLKIENGWNLICGDTHSDVAMVKKVAEQSKDVAVIFVTEDKKLMNEVLERVHRNQCLFVTAPDILVSIFNKLAIK
ncbi:MAG TPA: hypothetical protein VJ937_10765 [Salinivirga sp.]|uniref:hypothetical protein n=1 Tax=Salinivirga sp. TaxID=1970192 RepID=UPI002B483D3B|nr:hypothetical protein [Salinivirga sp.]HKK59951.1 hypothetical protein [Salinivirga sp.]